MRENCPAHEEAKVVHWGQPEVLPSIEFQNILDAKISLYVVQRKEFIGTQKAWVSGECLHDYVRADNNGENQLLEKPLDHPWIYSLRAHQELGRDAELAKEEANEFVSFDRI